MKRVLATAVTSALAVALALALSATLAAAAVAKPTVAVTSRFSGVPASGGALTIRARTTGGSMCAWTSSPRLARFDATLKCTSAMDRVVRIPPSTDARAKRFTFTLTATSDGLTADSHVVIARRAYVPVVTTPLDVPLTATLVANQNTFASAGGTLTLTYSSTGATSCEMTSTPAFWVGSDPTAVSCNGSYQAAMPTNAIATSWVFTFTATSAGDSSATSSQTVSEQAPTFTASPNWSGFVIPSSSIFTETSGEWTVPTLDCAATPNAGVSTWVGIGGASWPTGGNAGPLLQTGVAETCVGGLQQDVGWWELWPVNAQTNFASFPVAPGDLIQASVYQSADGAWTTRVDDLTTGLSGAMSTGEGWGVFADISNGSFPAQGSTAGLSYSGAYSAEWIVEDFTRGNTEVPLANFGTVSFTDLETSLSGWTLTPGEGVYLSENGTTLSMPSAPSADGFSLSYAG